MKYWLRRILRKERTEHELDSELRFHLEQRVAELVEEGAGREEASRQARMEFGGVEGIKEECRESRRVHLLETFFQDVRYGLRMLRRNPGFAMVAILTLALGIGANTAIFSVVNGVLLNPLPYPFPEQLITLHESKPNFQYGSVSYPNFRDWQKSNRVFSAIGITRYTAFGLTGMGDAEQLNGVFISSDLLPLLGIKPLLGRGLAAGEDEVGAAPVVLISAGLWQRKFASSPEVLGKSLTLDAKSFTIIGVVPTRPDLAQGSQPNDIYMPIGQWTNPLLTRRTAGLGIHGVGRLKDGVTFEQARSDMDRVAANLAAAYPDEDKGIGASLIPLRQQVVGRVQPFLIVLLACVGFVLLIACVNVANLLLARSVSRKREFGVRVALGAPAGRIVRQLLTESILLAGCGGLLALALAQWTTRVMLKMLPDALPRAEEIGIDAKVMVFSLAISVICGVLFGLFPAMRLSRLAMFSGMKGGARSSNSSLRAQNTFVAVETALALVLLVGAGLMVRTLARLWEIDPGFNPHNVLTFNISLPPGMIKAESQAIRANFRQLEATLASASGVQAVSFTWGAVPLQYDDEVLFWMDGQPKPSNPMDMNWALSYVVSPGYLQTMRIPLLRGRFFTAHDDEHGPTVVVIDEALAERFFPGQDPLGKLIRLYEYEQPVEVVGVVKHVKQFGLDSDDQQSLQAQMYRSFIQLPDKAMVLSPSGTGVVVRYAGKSSAGVFDSIRSVVRRISRDQVISADQTMDEAISSTLATRRYSMILLTSFAALALLLAGVGIYGVMSYVVGQRTQEIGIRMALGARRGHVLVMVMSLGAKMALMGAAAGLLASLALSRLMGQLLYGVSPTDPLTFTAVAALLALIALLACYLPARRATKVDPMMALRCE